MKEQADIFDELSQVINLEIYNQIRCNSENLIFVTSPQYNDRIKRILDVLDCVSGSISVVKHLADINGLSEIPHGKTIIVIGHDNTHICIELAFTYSNKIVFCNEHELDKIYEFSLLAKFKDKINEMYSCLSDDISKKVISNILLARITGDYSYIKAIRDTNCDNEYFDINIMKYPSSNESFIDAGAYVGDTLGRFLRYVDFKFETAFLFEPDRENFNILEKQINRKSLTEITPHQLEQLDISDISSKLSIHNVGVFDKQTRLEFSGKIGMSSHVKDGIAMKVDKRNNYYINVIKLDDFIDASARISMIKMDIEGSESEALMGCERIIRKDTPKLMICIYHKPNHLWDIPLQIKSILPDYELYIRHYGAELWDTICYAIPENKK